MIGSRRRLRSTPSVPGLVPALLLTFGLLLTAFAPAGAQGQDRGVVDGRITDAASGAPISSALITVRTLEAETVATGATNRDGIYRLTVPVGDYEIQVSAVGYGTQLLGTVTVTEGARSTLDGRIESVTFELNPLVISVGREAERAIGAPARVEVISEERIAERPAVTPVDHLRSIPAVDVIQQGVQSTNVTVRGFNNIFSGALHALTDHRIAGVPSLRVNVLSFVPTTDADIERMEVVMGPGSALYGPNTANGVLHIMTRSPLQSQGSSVSVTGGERSMLGANVRTSHLLAQNLGIKVSAQYLRAEEWAYTDPVEAAERAKFDDDREFWRADLMRAVGIDQQEADVRIDRIADRSRDIERWAGELRADWAVSDETTAILTLGRSNAGRQVEMTGLGAAQVRDWSYTFAQARLNRNRLFAQAYLNRSDAGTTYLLRNGAPIVDRSRLFVAQLQHGTRVGTRQQLTYGVDVLYTDPETEGTINGIYEDEDDTTEFGAYVQSETRLSPVFNLVLAGRVDTHSALPDAIFSPRAALVWEPAEDQAFRLTYNRAFSTPSSLNQFLDLGTAIPDAGAAQLGYSVRVQGTGTEGFRLRQPDGSWLMRSPFTPDGLGGPAQLLPASAATFWDAAVQVVAQQAGLDPQLAGFLQSLDPSAEEVGSSFSNPVTGQTGPLSALDLPDIEPIRESLQSTIEVGYKGILAERAILAADVWYSRRSQLVTPLTVQTPFVTLDAGEVEAFLAPRLEATGMSSAEAAATAAQLAGGMSQVPLGVISAPDINANGAQLLSTYTNVDDELDLWGMDLSAQFLVDDRWSVEGALSLVNDDAFTTDRGQIVTLNAPKRKGSLTVSYRDRVAGLSAEGRMRVAAGFPATSGVYEGTACLPGAPASAEPCVESSTLLDANVSYRLPNISGATVQLSIQNLLDQSFRSFPGTPETGRLALLRLRYEF